MTGRVHRALGSANTASFSLSLWEVGGETRGLGGTLAGIQPRWVIRPGEHLFGGPDSFAHLYSAGKPHFRSWDGGNVTPHKKPDSRFRASTAGMVMLGSGRNLVSARSCGDTPAERGGFTPVLRDPGSICIRHQHRLEAKHCQVAPV